MIWIRCRCDDIVRTSIRHYISILVQQSMYIGIKDFLLNVFTVLRCLFPVRSRSCREDTQRSWLLTCPRWQLPTGCPTVNLPSHSSCGPSILHSPYSCLWSWGSRGRSFSTRCCRRAVFWTPIAFATKNKTKITYLILNHYHNDWTPEKFWFLFNL